MSYRGRPSKGCEQCRARKIKCDEKKPICTRCSKVNNSCTYRDQAELLFRNQSHIAAQKAEHSWRKRAKPQKNAPSKTKAAQAVQPPDLNGAALTMPPAVWAMTPEINPNPRSLAYERFEYDFLLPISQNPSPQQPTDDLFTFIPAMYRNAPENSTLVHVVNAIAYLNFAHRHNAFQAEALAEQTFWKAINSLSKVVADKRQAATNEALCSVYMMGVYELFSIQQRKGSATAHQTGANALLHLRSVEEYCRDSISARLYETVFWQQLLAGLQAARHLKLPIDDIINVKSSLLCVQSRFLMKLIWRVVVLRAQWHEIKRSGDPPTSRLDLHILLRNALDLDAEFEDWEANVPPDWRYKREPNTPEVRARYNIILQKLILETRGAPKEIHSYTNLKKCWVWGFCRLSRIYMLRDLTEMLNWTFRLPEPRLPAIPRGRNERIPHYPVAPDKSVPFGLDNRTLLSHLTYANVQLVNVIENFCAGMANNFTTFIETKHSHDVVSMRGFTCVFTFGATDAALASGRVPDLKASEGPPSPVLCSPQSPLPPKVQSPTSKTLDLMNTPPMRMQLAHRPASTKHWSDLVAQAPSRVQPIKIPTPDSSSKSGHIFDPTPPHAFDRRPTYIPDLDFTGVEPKKMDVAARREWLNLILYYIGTELGINKALYVPFTEGYMPIVKPIVDGILGR